MRDVLVSLNYSNSFKVVQEQRQKIRFQIERAIFNIKRSISLILCGGRGSYQQKFIYYVMIQNLVHLEMRMDSIQFLGQQKYEKEHDLKSVRFEGENFSFDKLNENYILKLKRRKSFNNGSGARNSIEKVS